MVKFGDVVCDVKVTVDPDQSGLERYVAGEHMSTDDLHIRSWGTIGEGYLGPAFHRKFVKGQILYGSRRTYLRKVAVAEFDGICANTTFVLEPKGDDLLPELLPFIMQTDSFNTHAIKQSRGSVNPYVNWKDIAWYEFALPPKDKQHSIANTLWAADETMQKATAVIESVDELIAAIKKQEFSGSKQTIVRLKELCEPNGIQIGPFGSQLHASDYVKKGVPVIMPSDMKDGFIDEEAISRITPEMANRLSLHKVLPGDILLPRRGELDRRAFILPEQSGWICGTGSIRVRVQRSIPSLVVFYALSTPQVITWLRDNAVGTTMPNLNATIVSNTPICLPKSEKLQRVVDALESANTALQAAIKRHDRVVKLKKQLVNMLLGDTNVQ